MRALAALFIADVVFAAFPAEFLVLAAAPDVWKRAAVVAADGAARAPQTVLFFMCAANELTFASLYLLFFTEGPSSALHARVCVLAGWRR